MTKHHKMSGSHRHRIEAVEILYRGLENNPNIKKFGFGPIKPGAGSGQRRIKMREDSGSIVINVRGQTAVQILRVYARDIKQARADIALFARDLGWPVSEE